MQKHTKVYLQHFDITPGEFIACEVCGSPSVDIHHIQGRVGKDANKIENLMALCRDCHTKTHSSLLSKKYLSEIHKIKLHI